MDDLRIQVPDCGIYIGTSNCNKLSLEKLMYLLIIQMLEIRKFFLFCLQILARLYVE